MITSEPGRRKADIRARLSPESLAKLAARQHSSTQFVNFMRDKLMERLTVEARRPTPGREGSKAMGQAFAPFIAQHKPGWHRSKEWLKTKAGIGGQSALARTALQGRLAAHKEALRSGQEVIRMRSSRGAGLERTGPGRLGYSQNSSTQFVNFMRYKLIEMKMHIGPIAKRYGEKRMGDKSRPKIKDPVVRTAAKKYQKRVSQKLRTKVNLPVDVAVQGSLNVRRRRARAGKSVPGSPRMRPESAADRRADFEQDKERRKAPGDR